MAAVLLVIGFLLYLFLLVDWKDFRFTCAQGGWVSVCLYILLAVLISGVITSTPAPDTTHHAPAAHHG